MQIFKTFLKISLRNIGSGLIYVAIFLGVSFGVANAQNSSNTDIFSADKIDVIVIDRDNSSLSKSLYDYIDRNHRIRETSDNEEAWIDEIFAHTAEYVLVIEDGFEAKMTSSDDYVNCLTSYSAPDSNSSYIIASQTESWCQNINYYLAAGYSLDEASAKTDEISKISAEVSFINRDGSTDKITAMSIFFIFMPYIMLCILINTLGPMLIIWNRPEIKSRTAISGMSSRSRNWGIIAAAAVYSAIIMVIFIIVCANVYKKDFFSEITPYYLLNMLCCLAVCIATTFLISQLGRKVTTLSIWSNTLGLSSSFLCGVFVSRSLLPDGVVSFSRCLPTYWYINVTEELSHFNGSLSSAAWRSMGVQLLFAAAITAVAFAVIRFKQQNTVR